MKHIRCTGLLQSRRCRIPADSPDIVLAASDEEEDVYVFAVEVKTMVSVRTIQEATALAA